MPWVFYIIRNKRATYAGVTTNPERRLRAHNGYIAGGAKYTRRRVKGGWSYVLWVSGFTNQTQALQFEWAVKHQRGRRGGGVKIRLEKLYAVLGKDRWTKKSPLARDIPLTVLHFHAPPPKKKVFVVVGGTEGTQIQIKNKK